MAGILQFQEWLTSLFASLQKRGKNQERVMQERKKECVEEFMFIFLLDFTVGQSTDEKEAASASLCIIVVKAFSPSCGA